MDTRKAADSFNFYLELSKPNVYESLVLTKPLMLALALLYQRERNDNQNNEINGAFIFSEEDIRDSLRQVMPPDQREQHERYNQFIRDLQAHFLWRDEQKGIYSLRDYARDFFRLMYDRLEKKFEPTYTKRIFAQLIESLANAWRKTDSDPTIFNHWVDQDFERSRTDISNQVEILYSRVDDTVQQLRDEVKPEAADFLTILQYADRNLDTLTKDADELNYIFFASVTIRGRLDELQHKPYAEVFGNRISKVSTFLSDIGDKLHLVRRRIKKIRPHIQRLFNVQQREFDMNTGKFLAYLLEHSQISYQKGIKQIEFPDAIEEKSLFRERLIFTQLNKQTFLPPKPIRVERAKVSTEVRQKQEKDYQQELERNNEIQAWLENIQFGLEAQGKVILSDVFYQILNSKVDGTAMALEVVQRTLSHYGRTAQYRVKIGNVIRKTNYPHHTICEITIQHIPLILS